MRWFEDFEVGAWQDNGSYELTEAEIIEWPSAGPPALPRRSGRRRDLAVRGAGRLLGAALLDLLRAGQQGARGVQGQGGQRPRVRRLRLHAMARPGDVLTSSSVLLETRVSQSKPHLGTVRSRTELANQRGEQVFSLEGAVLIERRPPNSRRAGAYGAAPWSSPSHTCPWPVSMSPPTRVSPSGGSRLRARGPSSRSAEASPCNTRCCAGDRSQGMSLRVVRWQVAADPWPAASRPSWPYA